MLKIENYYKLCNKPVGDNGWKVLFCDERPEWYEIHLEHKQHQLAQPVTIKLSRVSSLSPGGLTIYRFMDERGEYLRRAVTANWISNMDNMLSTLKRFVTI